MHKYKLIVDPHFRSVFSIEAVDIWLQCDQCCDHFIRINENVRDWKTLSLYICNVILTLLLQTTYTKAWLLNNGIYTLSTTFIGGGGGGCRGIQIRRSAQI